MREAAMSLYRNRIYPHIVTVFSNPRPVQEIRQQLLPLAQETVLEVSVGPGVNFPYCDPGTVGKVYALEPNPGMATRAENRRRHMRLDIEFLDLPGERIPLLTQAWTPSSAPSRCARFRAWRKPFE
jgi:protein-L-isoaspartate O-methyltransferase